MAKKRIHIPGLGTVLVEEDDLESFQKLAATYTPEGKEQEQREAFLADLGKLFVNQSQENIKLFTRLVEAIAEIKLPEPKVNVETPAQEITIPQSLIDAMKADREINVSVPEVNVPAPVVTVQPGPKAQKIKVSNIQRDRSGIKMEGLEMEVTEWKGD